MKGKWGEGEDCSGRVSDCETWGVRSCVRNPVLGRSGQALVFPHWLVTEDPQGRVWPWFKSCAIFQSHCQQSLSAIFVPWNWTASSFLMEIQALHFYGGPRPQYGSPGHMFFIVLPTPSPRLLWVSLPNRKLPSFLQLVFLIVLLYSSFKLSSVIPSLVLMVFQKCIFLCCR